MKGKTLTDKQQAFCFEYIKDNNATQAAITAGYSKKGASVQGSLLLANIKIATEIRRLKDLELKDFHVTKSQLIEKTMGILNNMSADSMKENTRAAGVALKAVEVLSKMLGFFESPEEGQKQIVALQINVKTKNDE